MSEHENNVELPINWQFGNVKTNYATNLLMQFNDSEVYLSFFEIVPPLLLGENGRIGINSLHAECVARIVLPVSRLKSFMEVMEEAVNAFEENSRNDADEN